MKLKLLVTGRNRRMAVDLCEHIELDRNFEIIKCPVSKSALFDEVINKMPHVIIICAGDEDRESLKVYDVLKETARMGMTEVIVVASDDDRSLFMSLSKLEKVSFLARPVSLTALYQRLDEIQKKVDKEPDPVYTAFQEYVNNKPRETFTRKHILVIDDDPQQLMMIKEHLKEFYEVTVVNSGKTAFKVLKKFKVDLILLDYIMPEMGGPEVLLALREDPEYMNIPIVFLTGMSDREAVLKTLLELKPQGYLLKPSKKSEIVGKIIDILG